MVTAEKLESRRLLAFAYAIAQTTSPGTTALVSSGGALYAALYSGVYRSDASGAGTPKILGAANSIFSWNGSLLVNLAGVDQSLVKINPDQTAPITITADGFGVQNAGNFTPAGDKLFFSATTNAHFAISTYVTDGTSAGTHYLCPGTPMGAAGGYAIISDLQSNRLWRTDGTAPGTLVIQSNVRATMGAALGNALIFQSDGGLCKTDGTASGTTVVRSDVGGTVEMRQAGNLLFFVRAGGTTTSLWSTDGTATGTVLRSSIASANLGYGDPLTANVGDTLYFEKNASPTGMQLFSITPAGMITQITTIGVKSGFDGLIRGITAADNQVFFTARSETAYFYLYSCDGQAGHYQTIAGTLTEAGDQDYAPKGAVEAGGSFYFTQRKYNGGTVLLRFADRTAVVQDGSLVVNGTDPAEGVSGIDTITVVRSADNIVATVNGVPWSFPVTSINRVIVNAMGGDDSVSVADDVAPLFIFNASSGVESQNFTTTGENDLVSVVGTRITDGIRTRDYRGLDNLSISTLDGIDHILIGGAPATNLTINAGLGDDVVNLGNGDISLLAGSVTATGGGGADQLSLDDSQGTSARTMNVSDAALVSGSFPSINYSGFSGVSLLAGASADKITALPGATPISIDGGAPGRSPTSPGDILIVQLTGATGATLQQSAVDAGIYSFTNREPIAFQHIETFDDLAPPQVLSSTFIAASQPHRLVFTFSEAIVPTPTNRSVTVTNLDLGASLPSNSFASTFDYLADTLTLTYTAQSPVLPDGNYRATLPSTSFKDAGGTALPSQVTLDFFVLSADGDGNRKVDIGDFNLLATNFGTSGQTFSQGNYDYSGDGKVTILDFNVLATNFGKRLDPPTSAQSISSSQTYAIGEATLTSATPDWSNDPLEQKKLLLGI